MKNEVETWLTGRDSKVTPPLSGPEKREQCVAVLQPPGYGQTCRGA